MNNNRLEKSVYFVLFVFLKHKITQFLCNIIIADNQPLSQIFKDQLTSRLRTTSIYTKTPKRRKYMLTHSNSHRIAIYTYLVTTEQETPTPTLYIYKSPWLIRAPYSLHRSKIGSMFAQLNRGDFLRLHIRA